LSEFSLPSTDRGVVLSAGQPAGTPHVEPLQVAEQHAPADGELREEDTAQRPSSVTGYDDAGKRTLTPLPGSLTGRLANSPLPPVERR
jgi:hypothetical protein